VAIKFVGGSGIGSGGSSLLQPMRDIIINKKK